ncbi:uncharacterized protein LOC132744291 [Ruditapes philippinarum]|uniref:uncharacterized protein LOC132744291 n=1 Tax=Ruditapes philippinarum TaxID=129788 RepID=UPI00295B2A95|nr:uncharacterized protein LOC132744291 [Ruditapes philippinarum]
MHSKKLMSDHKFLSALSASSVSSRYFEPMTIEHLIEKRPCIVFNVLVKGIIPLNEECFPTELDGMPVDVREGGVRLCVNKADEYQENATLGCKITSSTCPGKSGTLGGFIEHPEYGLCGITCAHVVANDDDKFKLKEMSTVTVKEDHIMYQPDDDDKSKNKLGKLVQLTYKEGENGKPGVDLALFRIEKRAPKEGQFPDGNLPSFNTGLVWGKTGIPSGQRNVQKFGYVTLNTSGVMQFDNCAIKEEPFFSKMTIGDDRLSLTTTLYKQYQIKSCDKNIPFCKQGDSGALVFMEDNTGEETTLRCIGMLVGLTDDNSGYVTPITAILDELKVKQLKPFTTHSTNSTILEQISGMLNTHFDRFNERFRQLEERISRIEADNKK